MKFKFIKHVCERYIICSDKSLKTVEDVRYMHTLLLDNPKSVLISFGIQTTDEELDLQYINLDSKDAQNSL